jgi:hypothetical protein
MAAAPQSLVNYNPPLRVTGTENSTDGSHIVEGVMGGPESKVSKENSILEMVLPARRWEDSDGLWMQTSCSNPATRYDVMTLQEKLDDLLYSKQARDTGTTASRFSPPHSHTSPRYMSDPRGTSLAGI